MVYFFKKSNRNYSHHFQILLREDYFASILAGFQHYTQEQKLKKLFLPDQSDTKTSVIQ